MEFNEKEVYFNEYCVSCKHYIKSEDDEPCCNCLINPVNINSHKPIDWAAK